MHLFITLIKCLPKNLVSFITGVLVRITLPPPLGHWLNVLFVKAFQIDMGEAELPLHAYKNIEAVFIRRLKPALRKIQGPICSPADGSLSLSLPCEKYTAVQAKSHTYNLNELVFGRLENVVLKPAWYFCVYLAPHNYHRVHAPFSGTLQAVRYISGNLWPVNNIFCDYMPSLFTRNERLVFDFTLEPGAGRAYVVMVGALNVGRMTSPFLPLTFATNAWRRQLRRQGHIQTHAPTSSKVELGDELGTFMLGSTVVVVFDESSAKSYNFTSYENKKPIRLGDPLASFR